MKANRFVGIMMLMATILLIVFMFGSDHIYGEKDTRSDIFTGYEIQEYGGLTDQEQGSLAGFALGMLIGALALVYIGGIVYDEYAGVKDHDKGY